MVAVFLGVLLNAERERTCSRMVVLPALILTAAAVAMQLRLDENVAGLAPVFAPMREVLQWEMLRPEALLHHQHHLRGPQSQK